MWTTKPCKDLKNPPPPEGSQTSIERKVAHKLGATFFYGMPLKDNSHRIERDCLAVWLG